VTGGYPPTLPPVKHTAPVPRRIRATLARQTVLDTMSALPFRPPGPASWPPPTASTERFVNKPPAAS
jgi:hypothetical protein